MKTILHYIASFDGLRALTITLVIVFLFRPSTFFGIVVDFGLIGVQLFFVASCFYCMSKRGDVIHILTVPNGYRPREDLITKPVIKINRNDAFSIKVLMVLNES